jgi:hypothetical protein
MRRVKKEPIRSLHGVIPAGGFCDLIPDKAGPLTRNENPKEWLLLPGNLELRFILSTQERRKNL